MVKNNNIKITLGWCDSGNVEGSFMAGVINTIIEAKEYNIDIVNIIRMQGNQISRQRQSLWDFWSENYNTEWLLWVDSDIVLTTDVLKKLISASDKINRPVITGVYFVSSENEKTLMQPVPAIYKTIDNKYSNQVIHPFPENEVITVDSAGFGLVLMHRSIIDPVNKVAGNFSVFGENQQIKDKFIGEDFSFFNKLKSAGIQLYAHTGAIVRHMKTFSFDENYYNVYWHCLDTNIIKKEFKI